MMDNKSTQLNAWEGVLCDTAVDYHSGFNLLHFAAAMLQSTRYHTKWEADYVQHRLDEERAELNGAIDTLIAKRDAKSLFAVIDEVADVAFYTLVLRNYKPSHPFHCTINHIKACVLDVLYEALGVVCLSIDSPDEYQAVICDLCDATLAHTHAKWLVRSFTFSGDLDQVNDEHRMAEYKAHKDAFWALATRKEDKGNV